MPVLDLLSQLAAALTVDPAVPDGEARAPAPPEDAEDEGHPDGQDGDLADAAALAAGATLASAHGQVVPRDPAAVGADTRGQPVPEIAVELVARFEGFRSRPYRCPKGQPTQGYGRAFSPTGRAVRMGDPPVTEATARRWLAEDLAAFAAVVDDAVAAPLAEHERAALVSLSMNIGEGAFRGSTLVAKLNAGNRQRAAMEFARWARTGNPPRLHSVLVKRRAAEAALFLSTKWLPGA